MLSCYCTKETNAILVMTYACHWIYITDTTYCILGVWIRNFVFLNKIINMQTRTKLFFRFPSKSLSNCLKGNIVIKIRKSLCFFNVCQLNVELPIKPNLSSAHFRFYRINRKWHHKHGVCYCRIHQGCLTNTKKNCVWRYNNNGQKRKLTCLVLI